MKTILLSAVLAATIAVTANAQNINIPDANFKAYLVGNTAINTDGDSEISFAEATAFAGTINCSNLSIADLTGIETFTNITVLYCNHNQLTSLNVSNNTALTELGCENNQLTTLNVSNNTALTELWCRNNQLTTLNVSNNTALTTLWCVSNQLTSLNVSNNTVLTQLRCSLNLLTSLNVSNNTALTYLDCNNNQLTSLNVANGNNTNFTNFNAKNNPNLTCIQVDDANYSTTNWTGGTFQFDATASFSEDCALSVSDFDAKTVRIYPNPANSTLNIEVKETANIKIVNMLGATVATQNLNAGNNSIDVSSLTKGIYFIQSSNGGAVKFIKE